MPEPIKKAASAAFSSLPQCPVWRELLQSEAEKAYFSSLQEKVAEARQHSTVYPPAKDVLSAFSVTPFATTKVVILGQDPYHGTNQANGLAFSVAPGVKIPPSLRNIYKAVFNDYPDFKIPAHGDLSCWAEQGVLLLNTVLTVEEGKAHSHAKWGWEALTTAVLEKLDEHPEPLVFLLWGKHAQSKASVIKDSRHLKLSTVHPSPLSAHRGFLTCGHFKTTNQFLRKHSQSPVDWTKLPAPNGSDSA